MKVTITFLLTLISKSALPVKFHKKFVETQSWTFMSALLLFSCSLLLNRFINIGPGHYNVQVELLRDLCVLLFMPCAYLYLRSAIFSKEIEPGDGGHVIPIALYLVNFIPVFFAGSGNPSGMAGTHPDGAFQAASNNFLAFNTAGIGFYCNIVFIYILLLIEMVLSGLKNSFPRGIRKYYFVLKWIPIYLIIQLFFTQYKSAAYGVNQNAEWDFMQLALVISMAIIIGTFAVMYTRYSKHNRQEQDDIGLEGTGREKEDVINRFELRRFLNNHSVADRVLSHGYELPENQLTQIEEKISNIMLEGQGFLNHGYTIRMLSNDTGIQSYILSAYINRKHGVNFNDFINEFRINYCIEKIKNQEWKYKTLEAISKESGFNNRNSFTLSFKKIIGVTPSDFLKQFKHEN